MASIPSATISATARSAICSRGRFKAILVNGDAYLLEVCRYVDLNPVRARMVAHPEEWSWSSYAALAGHAIAPPWLDVPAVHAYLLGREITISHDPVLAAKRYVTLVANGKDVALWEQGLRQQIYLGDEKFVERMQALLTPAQLKSHEVPRIQRNSRMMSVEDYLQQDMERNDAIVLAHREGRHTMSAIAREAGLSVSRVSRVIAAAEGRAKGQT